MPADTSPSTTSTPTDPATQPKRSWRAALAVYREAATWRMLSLGFSSGLPLVLVLGSLSFRMREAGVDRTTIGFLSWVGLMYAFKWTWAPLVDRLAIPWLSKALGRRRAWLLTSQAIVMAGLVGLALSDAKTLLSPPHVSFEVLGSLALFALEYLAPLSLLFTPFVLFALLVAWGSATQDIALDAYRIESADVQRQAALAAAYQSGYRIAMIWAGAGVLWIAARAEVPQAASYQHAAWQVAYLVMAASMLPGMLTVLLSKEPAQVAIAPAKNGLEWLRGALVEPFADFIRRYRWQAVLILALMSVYRISDVVMGIMAQPFYVDMGYTKDEVAAVTKVYGLIMTLLGAFVGGALAMRWGMTRVLMLGAALSAATNVLYAWLSVHGHDVPALIWIISADNLASGMASAAFIAYMSSLTNVSYSATQYAMFSSLVVLAPKFLAGFSGRFVDAYGYAAFFNATALLGVPVLLLVWLATRATPAKP